MKATPLFWVMLLLLWLCSSTLILTHVAAQPPSSCSVQEVLSDDCAFGFDGNCDAGLVCASNTDCFDCDPCRR